MSNIRRRQPTEAEKARIRKAIAEESKPESIAANVAKIQELRAAKQQHSGSIAQRVLGLLRQRKDAEHLSLLDLQTRTGIDSGNLSRLLNADEPNYASVATTEKFYVGIQADETAAMLAGLMPPETTKLVVHEKRGPGEPETP